MGRGRVEGWSLRLRLTWIFLAPSPSYPAWRGKFLAPFPPLRPRKPLPHHVKLYFLLIFPTTITIFSNKMTCFNNKKILEPNKCSKLLSSVHYYYYFFFYFENRIILIKGTEAQKLTKSNDTSRQQPSKK